MAGAPEAQDAAAAARGSPAGATQAGSPADKAAGAPQSPRPAAAAAATQPLEQAAQCVAPGEPGSEDQPGKAPASAASPPDEEAAARRARREAWEREQEAQRRWDLQRRLADISTDVEFLAREVERVRSEAEVPLPGLHELPEGERAALEAARRKRLAELLVNHCKKALAHITTHKWSWPFNTPVDLRQYPDYAEAVKTPMDFGTVKRRIDTGAYRHPDDFLSDVRLVFENARAYNKPGSDVHVMANTLQERFEDRYSASVAARVAEEAAFTRQQQEEARRRHADAGGAPRGGGSDALDQHCAILVRYIDEVQACVLDTRSAAAALCTPVSREDKEALVRALTAMPQEQFELAVGLVMQHHPGLQPYDDLGFDLDALDALTLRQMQSFVRACEATEAGWRGRDGGGGARPPPVSWPGLVLGAGLRPYRPPASRRPKRLQLQQQVKTEQKEEGQQQAQQAAAAEEAGGQKRPASDLAGDTAAAASNLTPSKAAAAADIMSPPPVAGVAPVAGSAVGPKPLAAGGVPAEPAGKKQKAAAAPAAAAAAPGSGAAPFVPTSAQMAAVAAAGPQQQHLLAQMSSLLSAATAAAAAAAKGKGAAPPPRK